MSLTIRVVLVCCIALSACHDSPLANTPGSECMTGIAITAGTTPQFSWSPECHVQRVEVYDRLCEQFYCWQIVANQTNGIASPLTYGAVPANATQLIQAVGLLPGERYTVQISREQSGTSVVIATAEFTP